LTKHRNDELPSVIAADLVNYVVLASVYTTIRSNSYSTIPYNHWQCIGKMRTADLRNIQSVSRPYVDTDRTLTRATTLTETLTYVNHNPNSKTLFSHTVIQRQHFTAGRNHWVKTLVREVAGSNLNGRHFRFRYIPFLFPWTGVRLGLG